MLILGIESTCDETGAAVVSDGKIILSNIVASSQELHKKYGGIVPEVAAREQVKVIIPVISEAITKAMAPKAIYHESGILNNSKLRLWIKNNIDAIAVAYGPGLIGSLIIGVETAKALAIVLNKPLIKVNHLAGHIYANWIIREKSNKQQEKISPTFPLIALIVSGGHTDLVLMKKHGDYKLIGTTLDDAAGETFDKVARLLGLNYPGGPEIENAAQQVTIDKKQLTMKLPRPMINSDNFNFSFSGLKTAVVNKVRNQEPKEQNKAAIADELQKAIVDVLVKKTIKACQKYHCLSIAIGGGVSANTLLRSQMTDRGSRLGIKVFCPSKNLSIDNGAIIAAAAFYNQVKVNPENLQANPNLHY